MNVPENLYYTEDHEWLRIKGKQGTIGITDYAQSELGDIVFIEFPELGDPMKRGEPFGTIEAVKTVADLNSPVNGEVLEVNSTLEDAPEKVNSDPYGEGWIIKVTIEGNVDASSLLSPEDYKQLIA